MKLSSLRKMTLITLTALFVSVSPIQASGELTTSDTNNGVIVTTQDGDTIYLTTETNDNSTSNLVGDPRDSIGRIGPTQGYADTIGSVVTSALTIALVFSALLVLLYLVLGAFDWITSGGDKGKTESARRKMVAAIIGLLIVASSFAIFRFAIYLLGFNSVDELFQTIKPVDGTVRTYPSTRTSTSSSSLQIDGTTYRVGQN